jgi:hypothetical protein
MYDSETTQFWPTFKNLLAYTYNTTPHSTLGGKSPYELIFGRKPPLQPFGWPSHTPPSDKDFLEFLGLRTEELKTLRADTSKIIEFNMRTSLDKANKRLTTPEFLVGDDVIELEFKVQPKIVTPKRDWRPTYQPRSLKITEVISDAHVRVRDELGVERILHVDRLKRLLRRDGCIGFSNQPPKPLEEENYLDDSDSDSDDDNRVHAGVEHYIRTQDPNPEEILLVEQRPDAINIPEPSTSGLARIAEHARSLLPRGLRRSDRRKPVRQDPNFVSHGPSVDIYRSR